MEAHSLIHIPGLEIHTSSMIIAMLIITAFALFMKTKLAVVPSKLQTVVEIIITVFMGLGNDIMGPKGKVYMPLILTIFIYVLVSNSFGFFAPVLYPSTANLNTTAGLAIISFILYNIVGFKAHGIGYVKQFFGPVDNIVMKLFLFPIEVFSHFSRLLSLSLRLFANIFSHEILVAVLVTLTVSLSPVFYGMLAFTTILGVISTILQAFIFALLTMVYLGGALEEAH